MQIHQLPKKISSPQATPLSGIENSESKSAVGEEVCPIHNGKKDEEGAGHGELVEMGNWDADGIGLNGIGTTW